MIMVGPGTGIAPFRGFLQERRALVHGGRNWLFFGDQHRSENFYYRDDLEDMVRDGFLNRLDLAFSRDQDDRVYVQHKMLDHGADVWRWLDDGAHLYVCGDAARMAKDVDAALATRVRRHGGISYTDAVRAGMYTPLGTGDIDIAGIVSVLRHNGFDGWFVLEQDTILDAEPTDEGPVRDVLASVAYLKSVTA